MDRVQSLIRYKPVIKEEKGRWDLLISRQARSISVLASAQAI